LALQKLQQMKITLNTEDAALCHLAALVAHVKQRGKLGQAPRYNSKLNFHEQITELSESFAAELAVARLFGYKYDPFNPTFKTHADVGENLEIKWTSFDQGHLIIYPSDRNSDIAILVTNRHPDYVIKGWMPISIAKKDRYKKTDQDSWWISQINLQPIETLERSNFAHVISSMSNVLSSN
jgi:hypothetical protein